MLFDFCLFLLYMWINKAVIAVRSSIMGVYYEQNGNRACQVVKSVHNWNYFCVRQRAIAGIDCIIVYPARAEKQDKCDEQCHTRRTRQTFMLRDKSDGIHAMRPIVYHMQCFLDCYFVCRFVISFDGDEKKEILDDVLGRTESTGPTTGRSVGLHWHLFETRGRNQSFKIRSCSNNFLTKLLFIDTKWCSKQLILQKNSRFEKIKFRLWSWKCRLFFLFICSVISFFCTSSTKRWRLIGTLLFLANDTSLARPLLFRPV